MDTVQSLTKSMKGLMWVYVVLTLYNYNAVSGQSQDQQQEIIVFEKDTVTLRCNHKTNPSSLQAIVWVSGPDEQIVADVKNGTLNTLHKRFQGRGNISLPEGDLIITNVDRADGGEYKCYTLQGGARVDTEDGSKKLTVNVKPENHQILCSGQSFGIPNENCEHIRKDAIMSIQCKFASSPNGLITWSQIPMGCDQLKTESTSMQLGDVFQVSSVFHDVCDGQYCCVARYKQDITQVYKKCVTVGYPSFKPSDNEPSEKPEKNNNFLIMIIVCVCVLVGIIIGIVGILIICRYCNCRQLKDDCPYLCCCCPAIIVPTIKPTNEKPIELEDSKDMFDRDVYSSKEDIDPKRYDEPEPPPYSPSPPFTPVAEDEDTVDGPSLLRSANPPAYSANSEPIVPENQDHEVLKCANTPLLSSADNTQDSSKHDNLEHGGTSSLFASSVWQTNNNSDKKTLEQRTSEPLPHTSDMFENPQFRRCFSSNSANKKPVKICIYRKRLSTLM